MLSSSNTLGSSGTTTTTTSSPIFYVDNILSYLIDDDSTNYSTSYYHLPSPLIYNEIDYFGDFIAYHDELAIVQQSSLAKSISNNNNNSSIDDHTEDKKVGNSNKGGDHEVEINGIVVEDNGEMDHNTMSSSMNCNNHHTLMKRKKRTSNKERHSKIKTAHGIRDRRMRLSLQVARPFFELQDMLGHDKASKTVDWLMKQSKPAIDELLQGHNHKHGSPSSGVTNTTKCTTMSPNSDECDVESTTNEGNTSRVIKEETKKKEKRKRTTTKEERKVAREKAKKRTLERMQSRGANNNPFITTTSSNYQHQCFDDVCQNVTNYRISAQGYTMGGPQ